jgi:hypothetical protein
MTDNPSSDAEISKEHYEAVGRVSNAWATFEFYINQLIWWVANVEGPIGACLTAQYVGPGPKFRALAALVKQRSGNAQLIKSINQFSVAAQAMAGERNRWSHDPMFIEEETGEIFRYQVTADRTLVFELKPATLSDMQTLEKKIWQTIGELKLLGAKIASGIPPMQHKPPSPPKKGV